MKQNRERTHNEFRTSVARIKLSSYTAPPEPLSKNVIKDTRQVQL
jgi:hypothetical protein